MLFQTTIPLRFWEKVYAHPWGCWFWQGALDGGGYGSFRSKRTHRLAYEAFIGPIPDDLSIDHLCRNRACCNPLHLEAVTIGENIRRGYGPTAMHARKTHCMHGHPFDLLNTKIDTRGFRRCRECTREWDRQNWSRRVAEGRVSWKSRAGVAWRNQS